MKLAVVICATQAYTHAMSIQARRVQQCVALADLPPCTEAHVILSGDDSAELKAIVAEYSGLMPAGWTIHHVRSVPCDATAEEPHKQHGAKPDAKADEERKRMAFRRIADMREAAHACALKLGADYVWSLDSDVLPPPNALRASFDALRFDGGYYAVAFCPYPNLLWLGGLGEPGRPMGEDFLPHERRLPARLRRCWEACEARLKAAPTAKEHQRRTRLERRAKQCPPDGNIWEVIAKYGWRRRGWLDYTYPGIGLGAMVPSDWCGFGCTLMNRAALIRADFSSFRGHGTEDIFVIAHRWQPADLRIALLPHCPCDHVYMERKQGETRRTYLRAYHEPAGEFRGHLRIESIPLP